MATSTTLRTIASRSIRLNKHLAATRQFQTSALRYQEDSAFDPKKTRPESQAQDAGDEAKELTRDATSPTDSVANTSRGAQEGGSQGSKAEDGSGAEKRSGQSGGGSPNKSGGGKSGGGGGSS